MQYFVKIDTLFPFSADYLIRNSVLGLEPTIPGSLVAAISSYQNFARA